jgi:hypothetical protein
MFFSNTTHQVIFYQKRGNHLFVMVASIDIPGLAQVSIDLWESAQLSIDLPKTAQVRSG